MAVPNPSDDIFKFIEKARDIKDQLASNTSDTMGSSHAEEYIESLDKLNEKVSDPENLFLKHTRSIITKKT